MSRESWRVAAKKLREVSRELERRATDVELEEGGRNTEWYDFGDYVFAAVEVICQEGRHSWPRLPWDGVSRSHLLGDGHSKERTT